MFYNVLSLEVSMEGWTTNIENLCFENINKFVTKTLVGILVSRVEDFLITSKLQAYSLNQGLETFKLFVYS